jgi:DNA-directed RNA polymerase specialized sigma24 family protein
LQGLQAHVMVVPVSHLGQGEAQVKGSGDMADAKVIAKIVSSGGCGSEEQVAIFYATDNGTKDDGRPVKGGDVLGRPIGYVVSPEDRLPIKTAWTGMTDYMNAPPDYGTFFKQYLRYTRSLVSRFGVPPSDLEDVVSDIMARFLERDSIGVFSNDWSSRSATGKSNFRSYYSRFIVTYAQGMNRNVRRHANRNVLICDASVDDDNRTTWVDEHAPAESFEDTTVQSMDFETLVASLRAQVDPKLSETVDAVVELAMGGPTVKVAALARKLSCSQRVAKQNLEQVRGALGGLLAVG